MTPIVKFALGLITLAGLTALLMNGATPPGIAGEVLRHNRAFAVDASPLFYSDVAHMACLEEGVATMRRTAEARGREPIQSEASGSKKYCPRQDCWIH